MAKGQLKIRNISTEQTLSVMEGLHKKGITWMLLYVVFFLSMPNNNLLFKLSNSLVFVGMVMLYTLFVNKVLIREFIIRKRYTLFVVIALVSVVVWTYVSMLCDNLLYYLFKIADFRISQLFLKLPFLPSIFRMLWFLLTISVAMILYFQKKELRDAQLQQAQEKQRLDMELRYLKSQINPHFLFNALNNIYALVYTHDDNAADGVLKLSEMLRYVLVDCQSDRITIDKEVKYIENYIDFQMMRYGENCDVKFEKDIEDKDFAIVPMILQPLVENCFKYSRLDADPSGYVHLSIRQHGGSFDFEAVNSVKQPQAIGQGVSGEKSGIGLNNVHQRLKLNYAEDYVFNTEQTPDYYKVNLHFNNNSKTKQDV